MLPKIAELEFNIEQTETVPKIGKSFLFDFEKGDFMRMDGKLVEVTGVEALKVWIHKTLRTEKFRFKVYEGTEHGVTLEDLLGSNLPQPFIEAEIKREVTESLTAHPFINSIENWQFTRIGSRMVINFTAVTVYGEGEVSYAA